MIYRAQVSMRLLDILEQQQALFADESFSHRRHALQAQQIGSYIINFCTFCQFGNATFCR
jgi:hypothetical protein